MFPGLIVDPPNSTVVYPDTQAVFICKVTYDSVSVWFVNGTDSRTLSGEFGDDITTRGVGITMTLTIKARTQYNNTVVQCVAGEFGGTEIERSDNVTLTIQGTFMYVYTQYSLSMHILCTTCI